jgi:hypothetical protein
MKVECAVCGWWEEIESEGDEGEWIAVTRYSLHQLNEHPHTALHDSAVLYYVQTMAALVAPRNGALTEPRD